MEEGKGDSIRVTDETAATGIHSLKFTDAPGLVHRYNPHLFYSTSWAEGLLQEDVDLRLEAGCVMYHEWRDSGSPYHVGPDFRVAADGVMTAGGKAVGTIRAGQWMHVTLRSELGQGASGRFSLEIRYPGDPRVLSFENLPCSPEFKTLNWLGFSMDGDQHAVMYLDNLYVRPVRLQH
ncbi:MAG: hypothetical protein LC772_03810 [Chloroflexi bacterium]|nr:hypothetical protein [Chloroflexota bacterium]